MSVSQVENLRRLLYGLLEEIKSVRDDFTEKYNTFSSILTSLESLQPEHESDSGKVERDSESDAESSSGSSPSPSVSGSDAESHVGPVVIATPAAPAPAQSSGFVAGTSGSARQPAALHREPAFILDDNGNNLLYRPPFDPESALYGLTGALARGAHASRGPFHPVPTQGFSDDAYSSIIQYGNNTSILAYRAASATLDRVLASRCSAAGMTLNGVHAHVSGSAVASEQFQLNANAPKSETTQNPVPGNVLVAPQDPPGTSASPSSRSLPHSASEKLVIRIRRHAGSRLPLNTRSTEQVERSKDSKSRFPSPEIPELTTSLTYPTISPTIPDTCRDTPDSTISTPARITRSAKRKREAREESGAPDEEESKRSAKTRSLSSK